MTRPEGAPVVNEMYARLLELGGTGVSGKED